MTPTKRHHLSGEITINHLKAFYCKNHFLGKYEYVYLLKRGGGKDLMYLDGTMVERRANGSKVKVLLIPRKSVEFLLKEVV